MDVVRAELAIVHVNEILTQHLSPSDPPTLVNVSLDIDDDRGGEVEAVVCRLTRPLKAREPAIRCVFVEIESKAGSIETVTARPPAAG